MCGAAVGEPSGVQESTAQEVRGAAEIGVQGESTAACKDFTVMGLRNACTQTLLSHQPQVWSLTKLLSSALRNRRVTGQTCGAVCMAAQSLCSDDHRTLECDWMVWMSGNFMTVKETCRICKLPLEN